MKKFTIYVIRWSYQESTWKNSKPCESCTRFLKNVGIGTIIYTTGTGDVYKKEKVKDLFTLHKSSGMRMMTKLK